MRIARFESAGQTLLGEPDDATTARVIEGDLLLDDLRVTDRLVPIDRWLAPLVPTDILCIGLNYLAHAAESNSRVPDVPMLFIKASGTLNHPNADVILPTNSNEVDYEAELTIVMKRDAKDVEPEQAMDYVLGFTCANDVSAREWQRDKKLGGGQFARGKSFDGFCPLGPVIVTPDEIDNVNNLAVRCILNGQVMQDGNTSDMIFDIATLISSLSKTLTVRAGSVILTGTPPGVGFARTPPVFLKPGDEVVVEIEQVGQLLNRIVAS